MTFRRHGPFDGEPVYATGVTAPRPRESAFRRSNSVTVIAPESSSDLAEAISSVALRWLSAGAATERM